MLQLAVFAQLAIVVHAPDSTFACDAIDVTVAVSASGTSIPELRVPSFAPFDVLRGTPSPRIDFDSRARAAVLAEYRYTITTNQVGTFTIPAFEARRGDDRVTSRPLAIAVRPMRDRGIPTVIARARIDTGTSPRLTATEQPDTVFIGQQATYEVAVFLNPAVRERLRRQPTFYPPEMQAMLAYDLPPLRGGRQRIGSQCFDALVYRRALFPLVPGRIAIPPAQLVYSTGISATSLYSREESHELQTDSLAIVAVEPPASNRPPEYSGAVGALRVDTRLDSVVSRVGDPMLLTLRVTGSGNVKLFPRPDVSVPWASLVDADERVTVDSANPRIAGEKEFDWVLTPRVAGEFDVPAVRYGFFDPASRTYGVATTDAVRVRVAPGSLAGSDTADAAGALSIRTSYDGERWPPPYERPLFWLAMALVPLPALWNGARRRAQRVQRLAAPSPMRELRANVPSDPVRLRRLLVRALGERLRCNPEDFTHPGALERTLRRAGVSERTATAAELLLRELDAAAYAGRATLPFHAARHVSDIARAVDAEALSRSELPFVVPMLVLAIGLASVAPALAESTASAEFARGVSAYLRHDYDAAHDAFGSVARQAPGSVAGWVNYGTSALAAHDTAAAMLGWRQALALDPGASDARARISLLRHSGAGSPGWVPPLPRDAAVWAFAVLWIAAWALAYFGARAAWAARAALPVGVVGVIVGLVAIELNSRVSGSRLAVVRRAVPVISDPAIGMDRGPMVATGEIVRIAGRRGVWTRVEASDDRAGWIPAAELIEIGDRRPPSD